MTYWNRTHSHHGRSDCGRCPVRGRMLCAAVALDDLLAPQAAVADLAFEAGAPLYHAGDAGQAVHLVRQGAIKLLRIDAAGNQRIVRVLRSGDIAGLEGLHGGACRHTAVAMTRAEICRLPIGQLHRFILRHPGLPMRLLEQAQGALEEADAWLADLVSGMVPGRVRLARLLLRLRMDTGDRIHRLSLVDFGAILGLTPETVSRVLAEFMDEGVLVKVGKGMASRHFCGDIAALGRVAADA